MVMESSEEEEEYAAHEWITPQSSVSAAYQSHTEKVRRESPSLSLCSLRISDPFLYLTGHSPALF